MPFKPQRGRKNFPGKSRGGFGKRGRGYGGNRPHNNTKKPEYRHQDQLNEEDVGITEFINPLDGYTGVIKARFSDFQVSEINLDGTVAKLTDRSYPKEFQSKLQEFDYREISQSPISEIPQEKWDEMRALLEKTDDMNENPKIIVLDVAKLDKECRKKVHECIKKHFGQKLVANTKNIDHNLVMEIKRFDKYDPHRGRPWPQDKGEFVYFIVHKEMMDTMEACLLIGDKLKLKPSMISYAGVKDRRAKTTQWMCVKRIEPHKLISRTSSIRKIAIGNLEFKNKVLKIGDLSGNKFRIAIRNVQAEDDLINKSLEFIKENGVINYYGLQRFGNDKEVPTYLVGTKLLTQQWKEAIDLILKVKTSDDPELDLTKAKKKYHETKDAAEALKLLNHRNRSLEAKLLDGICKHKSTDYVNALENIPRNMRLMYIHSFQSLVWNKMASKRIKEFGTKPVEGDLVLVEESGETIDSELLLEKEDDENESELDESKSTTNEETKQTNDENKVEFKNRQQVKVLAKDDLSNYTIYDIVLPLPGYDIQYPENLKSFYKEAVEEHGLTLEMTQQRVKTYNLSGAYRKLMGKPRDMSWKIMYFNDPTKDLMLSDLEELKGWKEPESDENGKFKAIVMEFNLNPSSYATMVLREAMKCNTSSSAQAQNNYYAETKQNGKPNVNNKPKVFLDEKETSKVEEKIEDRVDSLLADKAKYQSFMDSILGDTSENENMESEADTLKRPSKENGEEPEIKKAKIIEGTDTSTGNEAKK